MRCCCPPHAMRADDAWRPAARFPARPARHAARWMMSLGGMCRWLGRVQGALAIRRLGLGGRVPGACFRSAPAYCLVLLALPQSCTCRAVDPSAGMPPPFMGGPPRPGFMGPPGEREIGMCACIGWYRACWRRRQPDKWLQQDIHAHMSPAAAHAPHRRRPSLWAAGLPAARRHAAAAAAARLHGAWQPAAAAAPAGIYGPRQPAAAAR